MANRFLNAVSIVSISLSVLIVGTFALFFINADGLMDFWTKGIRIMAYLEPDTPDEKISDISLKIHGITGVSQARFISKSEALEKFREQMARQSSLIDDLEENPLPDGFEICMTEVSRKWENFENIAKQVENLPGVDEVEYGQKWLGRVINIFNLLRLTGYAMGCLFFMATVFFVANTMRLVLYSRREEIEIMRMVGASDGFIKDPFYIQSITQGALGGIIGLGALFLMFNFVIGSWQLEIGSWELKIGLNFEFPIADFQILFLPPEILISILLGSMFVGWMGCYLSLKQFLEN
ncbi:ABC transporter permease [Desulfococcaceae bacterium HSG8]|nr:ABC transporter permease [Desulfococcaceae bacterium HSG8]